MAAVSKEEYLKRYLSNSDDGVKKKRKKKLKTSVKTGKSLIIDDDVNLRDIKGTSHDDDSHENLLELVEDNPLIFDEGGTTVLSRDLETIKKNEEAKKAMWAPVSNVSDKKIADGSANVEKSMSTNLGFSREGNERNVSNNSGRRKQRYDSPSPKTTAVNRKSFSADLSPPRRKISPKRTRKNSSSENDQSPTRRRTRHDSPDNASPRVARSHLSSDTSPMRKNRESPSGQRMFKKRHDSPDLSPKRGNMATIRGNIGDRSPQRRRGDSRGSPSRRSPSRRKVRNESQDISPPWRIVGGRSAPSPDLSPSRHPRENTRSDSKRRKIRNDTPDISPPRKIVNSRTGGTPPDLSPPRRKTSSDKRLRERNDTPEMSPGRKTANTSSPDLSPLRRDSRQVTAQRTRHDTPDQSPPRKGSSKRLASPKRQRQQDEPDLSPERKEPTKHERKAGLHSAAELKRENELAKRREDEMFSKMASSSTGRGAETVHRDKEGRKRDLKIETALKKEDERKKLEEDEKFMEWGKGLQQTKNARNKHDDDIYEMSKPLARYKDDDDLDQMLKEKDRSGDPMLAFLQKKKAKQDAVSGKKERPKYRGPPPPPNRFNIHPGYRWDGVDRSNGFEKKRFAMLANKGATRDEAYKWSTEDM